MKTVLFSTALLLSTFFASQAQSQPNSSAGVHQVSDFSYRVWASNPGALRGQVRVVDVETGHVLFEKQSAAVCFGQQFNMSNLPDGHYAFLVKIGSRQFRYALDLHTTSRRTAELRADTVRVRGALAARF